jgi:HPt (histidine-containing phosphotransfer) domain-containing protein
MQIAARRRQPSNFEKDYFPSFAQPIIPDGIDHSDSSFERLNTDTFDATSLWERVNRDMELLRDLVGLFSRECPLLLRSIETAIKQQSFADLQKFSHKLKGSILQFSGRKAAAVAATLEQMGKDKTLEGADQAFSKLKIETAELVKALNFMVHGEGPVI